VRPGVPQEGAGRIRLIYLELINYRKFRHARVEFPEGVIGIMGPNGAGKSTLIEAVSWALYGNRSESRSGKEGIKRSGAGPHEDCAVELEFELGQVQYRLKRSLRGKDLKTEAELMAGGGVIAKSDRGVTKKIEEILGMDHQAFFISVFARQKDLSALSALTPADRKRLVMRMLQLDVLQDVVDGIRRDVKSERQLLQAVNEQLMTPDRRERKVVLGEEIDSLESQIAELHQEMATANEEARARETELEATKGRREWLSLKEEEHRRVERRALDKRKEVEEGRRALELLDGDVRKIRQRLAALPSLEQQEKELEALISRKELMDEGLGRYERRKAIAQNINRIRDEIRKNDEAWTNAQEEINTLKGPQDSLMRVTSNLELLDQTLAERRESLARLGSERQRLQRETDDLGTKTKEMSRLGPESICPTCERPLGEHHHHLVIKLDEERSQKSAQLHQLDCELQDIREETEQARRRKELLEERKKKLQDDVDRERTLSARVEGFEQRSNELSADLARTVQEMESMGEVSFDPSEHREVRESITALRPLAERAKKLRGECSNLPDLEQRMAERRSSMELLERELRSAEEELAAVGFFPQELQSARDAYDAAFHAREAAYAEVSRKAMALELAAGRRDDRKVALDEVLEKERGVSLRATKVEQLATLEKVMLDFKQNVMERVVPTLSEVSSHLFTDMTDSRYGGIELDEDYEMQIYDGGDKYPLSRFSGGEGDLANLSLRLAISRLLADRSGNDINFLILDEIFGSQDHTRKRNIMTTLNRLEKQFHQIILITHIDDTKDLMTNVITIKELEDGTSAIEY